MAIEYYMNIPGVVGESNSVAHPQQISLNSLTFGTYTNTDSSGQPSGGVIPRAVDISLMLNMSSIALGQLLADRTVIPTVTLYAFLPGETSSGDILTISLTNAILEAQAISAHQGGERQPSESIRISYSSILVRYKKRTLSGFVDAGNYSFPPKS